MTESLKLDIICLINSPNTITTMDISKTIDDLDFLYAASLDEELSEKDRGFVCEKMKQIIAAMDEWLLNEKLTLRNEFKQLLFRIKAKAKATIAEIEKSEDVLLHWAVMRWDLLDADAGFKRPIVYLPEVA